MHPPLLRSFLALCVALCCGLHTLPALAETIDWPSSGALAVDPIIGDPNSLFPTPGTFGNSVKVNDSTGANPIGGNVFGGLSSATGQSVDSNAVNIRAGSIGLSVIGGYNNHDGNTTGNRVSISGGTIAGVVAGGVAQGSVTPVNNTDNRVSMSGGAVGIDVYGGYTLMGNSNGNSASMSGGSVGADVYGGYTIFGNSKDNSVSISGGSVVGDVVGGFIAAGTPAGGLGNVTGNSVSISGGSVGRDVYGGEAFVGNATGNRVSISRGSVGGTVAGGATSNGNATGNSVSISGGAVGGNVVGGATNNGNATGNSVTISGSPLLGGTLYGGTGAGSDVRTGNTLNVKSSGMTAQGVANFQNYSFYLPANITAGQAMLKVSAPADISNSTIGVGINNPTSLKVGDKVILLDTGSQGLTATGINTRAVDLPGMSLLYYFDLEVAASQLLATLAATGLNPQTKALSEGKLAGLAFAGQGADLVVELGLSSAQRATTQAGAQDGAAAFGAMRGGSSRYDTGSHVDVDGPALITGVARRGAVESGALLVGAFFEAGRGNYDTHNAFNNAASVRGGGDTDYSGAGVLGRYDLPSGVYFEGSARAGIVRTSFSSDDLHSSSGASAEYDSSSPYYGMHAGVGYVWPVSEHSNLDFSTRYLGTHQGGDSVIVAGDAVDFKAANSHRWRSGIRFNGATDKTTSFYSGVYYEYEFDGKLSATSYGYQIDTPELQGSTGMGELGVSVKPEKNSDFSFDLGVQGYTGVRQGIAGSVHLKWVLE